MVLLVLMITNGHLQRQGVRKLTDTHRFQQEIRVFFHGMQGRFLRVSQPLAWEGEEIFQTRRSSAGGDGRPSMEAGLVGSSVLWEG